jgi:hypothetical protein
MGLVETDYGLIYNTDGSLCVTVRDDDVPFVGARSFAIEESTSNIVPHPYYSDKQYNHAYDANNGPTKATIYYYDNGGYNNLPYRSLIRTVGGDLGSLAADHKYFSIEENKTYTVSAYMKANQNNVNVGQKVLSLSREGYNDYIIHDDIILTTQWKKYHYTFTATSDQVSTSYFNASVINNNNNLPLEVDWCCFQIEVKSYATSFTPNTRPAPQFRISNKDYKTKGVISFWYKFTASSHSESKYWYIINSFPNDTYNVVGSFYWEFASSSSTGQFVIKGDDGSGNTVDHRFSYTETFNTWHLATIIYNVDEGWIKLYRDGTYVNKNTGFVGFVADDYWYFGDTGSVLDRNSNCLLISNLLISEYNPDIWTDSYIQAIYQAKKPWMVNSMTK